LAIGLAVALVAWLQLGCFGLAIGLAAAKWLWLGLALAKWLGYLAWLQLGSLAALAWRRLAIGCAWLGAAWLLAALGLAPIGLGY